MCERRQRQHVLKIRALCQSGTRGRRAARMIDESSLRRPGSAGQRRAVARRAVRESTATIRSGSRAGVCSRRRQKLSAIERIGSDDERGRHREPIGIVAITSCNVRTPALVDRSQGFVEHKVEAVAARDSIAWIAQHLESEFVPVQSCPGIRPAARARLPPAYRLLPLCRQGGPAAPFQFDVAVRAPAAAVEADATTGPRWRTERRVTGSPRAFW